MGALGDDDDWDFLDSSVLPPVITDRTASETPEADMSLRNCTVDMESIEDKNGVTTTNDILSEKNLTPVQEADFATINEYHRPPRKSRRILSDSRIVHVPPPPPSSHPPPPPIPYPYLRLVINSSTQLLDRIGCEDGLFELPPPSIGQVYLATYPFGDKDVKKWSWLFAADIENKVVAQIKRGSGEDAEPICNGSRKHVSQDNGMQFAFLSCALDTAVVPEDTSHNVRFFVVVQNRLWQNGVKLLIAESRKAAGILIYFELLHGGSVPFVGAMVHDCQSGREKRYKRVTSFEEAVGLYKRGIVGVFC